MSILITTGVWNQISFAAKNAKLPSRVAVAYFGSKGPSLLPLLKESALVVDASISTVSQGGTSPAALETLRRAGVNIYSAQFLHAKVFAFPSVAFVGSANASQTSETKLIEAVLKVKSKAEIVAVRDFVESLCVTRLSKDDLIDLQTYYKAPKFPKPEPKQLQVYSTLLMDLTLEQGGGRESQVQPPKAVWETFFGIKFPTASLPTITLINDKGSLKEIFKRKVVKHHHTYTIELADAGLPRPAILRMRRVGHHRYLYSIHRPGDTKYPQLRYHLENMPNPFWDSGRSWALI
jgi:hypothetical protein